MDIDKTTYDDLSLFDSQETSSVFQKLNFTRTMGGKNCLFHFFHHPFDNLRQITETQKILQLILEHEAEWPPAITNGTVMVIEKFYDTPLDPVPFGANFVNAIGFRFLHTADYSLIKYSIAHFADFVRGMHALVGLARDQACPPLLVALLKRARFLLSHPVIESLAVTTPGKPYSSTQVVYYGFYLQTQFKDPAFELIDIYNRLDAWYSMALATHNLGFAIPVFSDVPEPALSARSLYHILLPNPVAYDLSLDQDHNFLFLTGANMAGKSTFIKAIGVAVFLAHLGMGVPALEMRLSLFSGLISNINVVDNIVKGESYFFNEVQRIKNTILKINNNRQWLILIDELFKGTNMQDAMKCSSTVIEGLLKIRSSVFILSTHLYEIGEELRKYPSLLFRYFETAVQDDQLVFSYLLKEGISNDRLGYLILKREKVVDMLNSL